MRIYFSGIGGVAIGPLAQIARDSGHTVMGSDPQPSNMTASLADQGVVISSDQSGDFLLSQHQVEPIDWYVHTAAMTDEHPEVAAAVRMGIRVSKRDELLAEIIKQHDQQLIAVSGTHGKTSTTALLVWCLKSLGSPVSYSVGAPLSFAPSGSYDPSAKYFVYECDEFDRNMLHFYPDYSLLPSLDYDHRDTYPTTEDYQQAFRSFVAQSKTVICHPMIYDYLQITPRQNDIMVQLLQPEVTLPGEHTRANASLVLSLLQMLGFEGAEIINAINSFPGAGRRFEKIAENVYSDYGHHPKEIAATLELATEVNPSVVLVYQPHQNIRQHEVMDQYSGCMDAAQSVYWLPTYLSREDPNLEVLPAEALSRKANHQHMYTADMNDELVRVIAEHAQAGTLVVCMGAGSIDGWLRDHADALK